MARFCASLHDRRRSRPVIICTLAISMSLALLQAPQLAPVRTSGLNCGADARRPSPEAYGRPTLDETVGVTAAGGILAQPSAKRSVFLWCGRARELVGPGAPRSPPLEPRGGNALEHDS